jgi:hypothetical protein
VPNSPSHDIASGEIEEDEKAAADNASDGGKSAERLWKIGEL